MKKQSSENKLVITEEFIFDQNKLSKDPNNHFKQQINFYLHGSSMVYQGFFQQFWEKVPGQNWEKNDRLNS